MINLGIIIISCSISLLDCSKTKDPIPLPHTPKMLYKSDFSPSQFTLATPDISEDSQGAWQDWTAINATTGDLGPVLPYDATYSIFQYICNTVVTPSTIGDYIVNEIQKVPGPEGDSVYALFQNAKQNILANGTATQDVFLIVRDQPSTEATEMYYSFWFMFQSDMVSKLGNNKGYDNWRMMSEWKTGGSTDYRAATVVEKNVSTGILEWISTGEGWDTQGAHHDYWNVTNTTVAVPVGEWFRYEVYWKRSDGSDGRYWAAVNGQVIVDHHGSLYPTSTQYPQKIDRIFLNNIYSGGQAPMQQWTTDLEIWDGFPCGEGVSCYGNP